MLQDCPLYAYIPASDLARAREFYEKKLGFKPGKAIADGVYYEFGKGTGAFLYVSPNAGTSRASQAFWVVEDVDREIVALKARGVVFETYDEVPGQRSPAGAISDGGAKAAWFKDTEGNIMALIQEL